MFSCGWVSQAKARTAAATHWRKSLIDEDAKMLKAPAL
jgi:hypothetical protein